MRTVGLAVIVGGVVAWRFGRLQAWPVAAVLVLWISFGGHWIELLFLNWLRPRIPGSRALQVAARFGVWFIGGVALRIAIMLTMRVSPLTNANSLPQWWVAGLLFIAIELVAHVALALRGRPNFYNGDG
ncbi:MAG: hypothetical protein ABJE10_20435 [bacterium]